MLTISPILYLNGTQKSTLNEIYFGDDGIVYIGIKNGSIAPYNITTRDNPLTTLQRVQLSYKLTFSDKGITCFDTDTLLPYWWTGTQWIAASNGINGSTWYLGAGAPSGALGVIGDLYLDTSNGNYYQKTAVSTWTLQGNLTGPTGAAGAPGTPGSVWRNGTGAPSSGLGIDGDYYLDDATGNVYFKASGAYTIVANIQGPPGTNGNTILNGAGAPSGATGNNGDFYIDTTAHAIYGPKTAGVWGSGTSLIGPTGATGATGPGYLATSTTSNTIGVTTLTFTTQAGLAYLSGDRVRISNSSSNYVEGVLSSYSGTTLVVVVDSAIGSGTFSSWNIGIAGDIGQTGATGLPGTPGTNGVVPIATATGTSDAIAATYSPPITLTDKQMCAFVATAANSTTTPTFSPNSLTAHTITKNGGQLLVAGDIPGALAVCLLEYNLANTRWELLNPATSTAAAPTGTAGGDLTGTYPNPTLIVNVKVKNIGLVLDGQGGVVSTGQKKYTFEIPFSGTITGWSIVASPSGSCVIDIWKANAAIPTVANTITASALPTLTSAQIAASTTLTGWTTSVAVGDIFGFNVNSCSGCTWITIGLQVTPT